MSAQILIVDDSRIDRRLAEACLQRAGYQVLCADNAQQAVERLALHPVDAVVSDLQMPGEDGFDLLRQVKALDAHMPFILLTGNGSESLAVEALQQGADDYVSKFDLPTRLSRAVERVLEVGRRLRQEEIVRDWVVLQSLRLQVNNDRKSLATLVPSMLRPARELGVLQPGEEVRVAVALEEALLNAMIHGNLEVSSRLRELDGNEFEDQIELRLQDPAYAARRVTVDCQYTRDRARFRITDQGPGFNVKSLPDPRDPERMGLPSGRGVLMMRAFMDEVTYNDAGNEVTLVKYGSHRAAHVQRAPRPRELATS